MASSEGPEPASDSLDAKKPTTTGWPPAAPAAISVHNEINNSVINGIVVQAGVLGGGNGGRLPPAVTPVGQLPAVSPGFTGREVELAQLLGALQPTVAGFADGTSAVLISAIEGMAGIGKTALAVQAAHTAAARGWFSGGIVFLDLHGYDPARTPTDGQAAVAEALRALGVVDDIPDDPQERAALYRSRLDLMPGPVLVIADNAREAAQVESLQPGRDRHRLLVTSRQTLPQFGARLISLDPLPEADAIALLGVVLRRAHPDDTRISSEPESAGIVAGLCGCLPLALRIAAALLSKDPRQPLAEFADRLRNAPSRVSLLNDQFRAVIPVFELSYRQLDAQAALMFRLFAINPGPDLGTSAMAVLADEDEEDTRVVLERLADAHIIERVATVRERWRMHDLVREYADGLAADSAVADDRDDALDRLLGYYTEAVAAANSALGLWVSSDPDDALFPSNTEALHWLEMEYPNVVAAVSRAAVNDRDRVAVDLASAIFPFLGARLRTADVLAIATAGGAAARAVGAINEEAGLLVAAASGLRTARRFAESAAACEQAAALFARAEDRTGEITALSLLMAVKTDTRDYNGAFAVCERAKALNGQESDSFRAIILNNQGLIEYHAAHHKEALALFREAAAVPANMLPAVRVPVQNNLGTVLLSLNEPEAALPALRDAVAIARDTGLVALQTQALSNLAMALCGTGSPDSALSTGEEAIQLARTLGNGPLLAEILLSRDHVLYQLGRYEEALAAGREAVAVYAALGDRFAQARALHSVGQTQRKLKLRAGTLETFRSSAALYRDLYQQGLADQQKGSQEVLRLLGGMLREVNDHQAAAVAYLQVSGLEWEAGENAAADKALENVHKELKMVKHFDPAEIVAATGGYPSTPVVQVDLSWVLLDLKRLVEAKTLCQQAVAAAVGVGTDSRLVQGAIECRCAIERALKQSEAAQRSAEEAMAVAVESQSARRISSAWRRVGWCLNDVGRQDDAIAALRTAVDISQGIDSEYVRARAIDDLGDLLFTAARWDEAVTAYTEAVAGYHGNSRAKEAGAAYGLCLSLWRGRRYGEAIVAARAARKLLEAEDKSLAYGMTIGIAFRSRVGQLLGRGRPAPVTPAP